MRAFCGLGRGFELGPLLGLDPLGLGQGGLGHGAVLGLEHGGLGLALARLAELVGLGLLAPAASACEAAMSALARFSPSTALALASAMRDAHSPLGVLHLGVALEGGRLLADLLLLLQLGHADRLLAHGLAGADLADLVWRWPPGRPSRARRSATRISPIFSLSATSPRAFWIACEAAFWPMASM